MDSFDLYTVHVMAYFLRQNAQPEDLDEVIEFLRKLKLDHYSLSEKIKVLENNINIDTKTGLLKYKENYLENVVKTASRALTGKSGSEYRVCYIRLDIDNFSVFNNKYGHDIGDKVLHNTATVIKDSTRPTDYCIRFGGEEFDVMLPHTDIKGAIVVLDKIMTAIRASRILYSTEELSVTASAGVSVVTIALSDLTSISSTEMQTVYHNLQREADNALYDAKFSGKNTYRIYDDTKREEYARIRKKYVDSGK